ncbi:MAG TPA: hypothetical protein VHH88_10565 [Verrucomicrobiae bacterium]|nr:hypothetical protein [Verrucomicrobiae bacterium]
MKKIIIVLIAGVVVTFMLVFVLHSTRTSEPTEVRTTVAEPPSPTSDSTPLTAEPLQARPPIDSFASPASTTTNQTAISKIYAAAPTNEVMEAVGKLVAPSTSYAEKQSLFKNLRESGKLDEALETVKQGAMENPGVAQYSTTAGELILQKLAVMSQQGAALNEMGILGMQADMYFDSALKSEPGDWEAQFYKAAAMAHWPLELNKSEEVITRFSNLIDQQERAPTRPEYANTYVLLGDYFGKLGQPESATATWQLGLQKFPADAALASKLAAR